MSSVFECSLSIDCCVDYGSVCNAPGILLNCRIILNKKSKIILLGFFFSYYGCISVNLKCSLRDNSIFNWKLCK